MFELPTFLRSLQARGMGMLSGVVQSSAEHFTVLNYTEN